MKNHTYQLSVTWTGNLGKGTKTYQGYSRNHTIEAEGKPLIDGSSDPSFRGDPSRYNPEELFLSSISTCHMLWYLHLCTTHGITLVAYSDEPKGTMLEEDDGAGRFTEVTLFPKATILEHDKMELARSLHAMAHKYCFIANSLNFPVKQNPVVIVGE